MIHLFWLFLHGHFETTPDNDFTDDTIHMILLYFPVLKAQDMRHSAPASRSLATWSDQCKHMFKPCTDEMKDEEMESFPRSAKKVGGDSDAEAPLLTSPRPSMLTQILPPAGPIAIRQEEQRSCCQSRFSRQGQEHRDQGSSRKRSSVPKREENTTCSPTT